jgi:hypothetical protein
VKLAKHNRVQLIWVPGHKGTEGNETADQLARLGSECPLIGPEPAWGISAGIVKKAVMDWANRDHNKLGALQTDKGLRIRTLLEESRNC